MSDRLARLRRLTAFEAAISILIVATATIVAAWMFEAIGYLPCDLCLKQRTAYYAGVPLAALVTWLAAGRGPPGVALAGFVGLALIFAANSVFGVYHAGVEWGLLAGPTDCTGSFVPVPDVNDFLKQLDQAKVVRCDAVAIRILGLSLAGWNAVISAVLASLAIAGAWRVQGSNTVSQYR